MIEFGSNQYAEFLKKVKIGIHEVSTITSVPARKIRYWVSKGFIETVGEGSVRQFDLANVKKIMLINELIEDGYSLDGAAKKVNTRINKLNKMFDLVIPSETLENSDDKK
ncbi:MerR family transcriptional regulator [Vibrio aestuarianus]|uniref:MerR family transcriptional regulator n=1 Tax=Vibrio aestuarianus TaxID=28171 RepID=UPI00237CB039|nr:MerR family transcriptional regulator [Vibrio aestuarianus]MDE1330420.1 MerR family transcriptional regulator [Vibrio aestuarianus]